VIGVVIFFRENYWLVGAMWLVADANLLWPCLDGRC
jgi:hypothetical protein